MNEHLVKGIRCTHRALASAIHDDIPAVENCLRMALAHLLELVDTETRNGLLQEYREEVAIDG